MRKSGFTIAEFIICIMIMFVVMGAVVSVPFKKAKTTKRVQFQNGTRVCDCNNYDGLENNIPYCDIKTIDNPTGRNEFFTIQLVGGGAAASPEIGGDAGESKTVYYPSMNGRYRAYLGLGGEYADDLYSKKNGGNTVLYKILDDGNYELIEFAAGGVGSLETIQEVELHGDRTRESLAVGLLPQFTSAQTGALVCGAGGNAPLSNDARRNGNAGGVVISW